MSLIDILAEDDMNFISAKPLPSKVMTFRQIDDLTFETKDFLNATFITVCRWVIEENLDVAIGVYEVHTEDRISSNVYAAYRFVFNNPDHAAYFKLRWS